MAESRQQRAAEAAEDDVRVYCYAGDPHARIFLRVPGRDRDSEKRRVRTEALARTLARIEADANPKSKGAKKKRGKKKAGKAASPVEAAAAAVVGEEPEAEAARITCWLEGHDGQAVSPEEVNERAWAAACALCFSHGPRLRVRYNAPAFASVDTSAGGIAAPIASLPLSACVAMRAGCAFLSRYAWYRVSVRFTADGPRAERSLVGRGASYAPAESDLACQLVLEATPVSPVIEGAMEAYQCECTPYERSAACEAASAAGSEVCEGATQHVLVEMAVQQPPPDMPSYAHLPGLEQRGDSVELRVVSWNILANYYLMSEVEEQQEALHKGAFDGEPLYDAIACHREARTQALLWAMRRLRADVLCLQEVDAPVYRSVLAPSLHEFGFGSSYLNKASTSPIGGAVAWRAELLELVEEVRVDLSSEELFARHPRVQDAMQRFPEWLNSMQKAPTTVQVVLLRRRAGAGGGNADSRGAPNAGPSGGEASTSDRAGVGESQGAGGARCDPAQLVCVANLHLCGRPQVQYVRMLQMHLVMLELLALLRRHVGEDEAALQRVAVLVCGDFNSSLTGGVMEYMRTGRVGHEHVEWALCRDFTWEQDGRHWTAEERETAEALAASVSGAGPPPPYAALTLTHPLRLRDAAWDDKARRHVPAWSYFNVGWNNFRTLLDFVFHARGALRVVARHNTAPDPRRIESHPGGPVHMPSRQHPSDHVPLVVDFAFHEPVGQ